MTTRRDANTATPRLRTSEDWLVSHNKGFRANIIVWGMPKDLPTLIILKTSLLLIQLLVTRAQGVPTNFICIGLGLTFIGNLWFLQDRRTGICFQQILECYRPNLLLEVH